MGQVAKDACGNVNWSNDSRCRRLKGHRGFHCDRYEYRWHQKRGYGQDDGYTEDEDRLAHRRGKFPNYRIKRIVIADTERNG